jgi:ADP-ribose pyrophosphatase YjhB (NUDIX family)
VSKPAPPTPVVAVGGIAVVDGALLMVRRAHQPEVGRWTVPGGRVEAGESVADAVERELREETTLDVRCGPLLGWAERRGEDYHFVILDFEVTVPGRGIPVAGGDATAVAWVPLGEVPALNLVSGLEEFLVAHGVLG